MIVNNDMFDYIDRIMRTLAMEMTLWNEDLFYAVRFGWQKRSKNCTELTLMTGLLLISAHILDPFWTLHLFRRWYKGIDINPEDRISYTTQYQEAFLKYVENE